MRFLQEALEQKRGEISGTMDEIRHTITREVHTRKEAVRNTLDWKHQVNRYPVVAVGGAMAAGIIAGRILGKRVFHRVPRESLHDYAYRRGRQLRGELHEIAEGRMKIPREKSRLDSAVSGISDVAMKEAGKLARDLLVPMIVGMITGKVVTENARDKRS